LIGNELDKLAFRNCSNTDIGCPVLICFDGEMLSIPKRFYFNEPNPNDQSILSELQKTIVNCVYLRHHNGYIRQKWLNTLTSKAYYFTVPYTFQLLGEYIIEIIGDMDDFIDETNIHLFRRFLSDNRKEYYRFGGNRNIRDYIGKKIFERLENR
jgi:hypothetical protein